jgi:periplasmic divalent cation tolerance protein
MKLYYITLNTIDEARSIGRFLLEKKLALCVNWFPITCAYRWEEDIVEEPEVVLIVKTKEGYRDDIERTLREMIDYNNFIAEITPSEVNEGFTAWLDREIPTRG